MVAAHVHGALIFDDADQASNGLTHGSVALTRFHTKSNDFTLGNAKAARFRFNRSVLIA